MCKDTGALNVKKLAEIRKAIRKKYANVGNIQNIFKIWDVDRDGALDRKEVKGMVNQKGIDITAEEADFLIASVDLN